MGGKLIGGLAKIVSKIGPLAKGLVKGGGNIAGGIVVGAAGVGVDGLTTLGLAFAMLGLFFILRVLFMLVKAYVSIIMLIIFAPLIIAFGTVGPGGVRTWFMNLLSNILLFPIVGLIFSIGALIADAIDGTNSGELWTAPYLGSDHALVAGLFSLGVLLLIPEAEGIIKQFMGVRGPEFGPRGIDQQITRASANFTQALGGRFRARRAETKSIDPRV